MKALRRVFGFAGQITWTLFLVLLALIGIYTALAYARTRFAGNIIGEVAQTAETLATPR